MPTSNDGSKEKLPPFPHPPDSKKIEDTDMLSLKEMKKRFKELQIKWYAHPGNGKRKKKKKKTKRKKTRHKKTRHKKTRHKK